jgi:hypothetical protein
VRSWPRSCAWPAPPPLSPLWPAPGRPGSPGQHARPVPRRLQHPTEPQRPPPLTTSDLH